MKIMVTRRLPEPGLERLRQVGDTWIWPHDRDMTREELMTEALDAEIMVALATDLIDTVLMDTRPALKLVANFAVGVDNIDLEAAQTRGITVTNTPGVLTEATADLTMTLLLAAARRVVEGDRLVRRGGFEGVQPEFHLGYDLEGKCLGIFGLGRIGAAVARRARAFNLNIIYHNRRPNPELEQELDAEYVVFDDLLARSDFLTVTAPMTPETRHRFTIKEFKAMKSTAVFVNTGRGPIVRETDLAEALSQGLITAAGLDVYEFEPQVEPRLLDLENVILCPHLGSATREVRTRMALLAADNVVAFIQDQPLPSQVV